MKQLLQEVSTLTIAELNRASEKFGERHASAHEAFAVMLEEVQEGQAALSSELDVAITRFWNATKENEPTAEYAEEIRAAAEHAAAEIIQVAAMAAKASRGYENEKT